MPPWPFWVFMALLALIPIGILVASPKRMVVRAMRVAITRDDGRQGTMRLAVRHTQEESVYERDIRVEAGGFYARETLVLTRGETLGFADLLEDLARQLEP